MTSPTPPDVCLDGRTHPIRSYPLLTACEDTHRYPHICWTFIRDDSDTDPDHRHVTGMGVTVVPLHGHQHSPVIQDISCGCVWIWVL